MTWLLAEMQDVRPPQLLGASFKRLQGVGIRGTVPNGCAVGRLEAWAPTWHVS